jgi:MT0933-like antitoxin protein
MGMFDELKGKAEEFIAEHKDVVEKVSDTALEKGGDLADNLTGGKFGDQIDSAAAKADEAIGE